MVLEGAQLKLGELAREFTTIRGIVFLLGKLCLICAVVFAYNIGVTLALSNTRSQLSPITLTPLENQGDEANKPTVESYNVITDRNIFGIKAKVTAPTPTPVSKLSLRLVGVNTTPGTAPFAIIEDTQKKQQEVFDINENVFNQAKLVEVLSDRIKINRDGKIETLVLEEGGDFPTAGGGEQIASIESSSDQTEFTVPESDLNEALSNLPVLLSQARAVPYFKNGQAVGMRLFAIRRDSLYEKLGLKNGDILKAVNDNNLTDPAQALKLFEQLKSERSINVRVERNGQEMNLKYDIR